MTAKDMAEESLRDIRKDKDFLVRPGRYLHYKGNQYQVIGAARHSETLEMFVVYKALYDSEEFGNDAIWIRPRSMFLETVEYKGKSVPRFLLVDDGRASDGIMLK